MDLSHWLVYNHARLLFLRSAMCDTVTLTPAFIQKSLGLLVVKQGLGDRRMRRKEACYAGRM